MENIKRFVCGARNKPNIGRRFSVLGRNWNEIFRIPRNITYFPAYELILLAL
jgi:hypothetical protein